MHPRYLRTVTIRSVIWLVILTTGLAFIWVLLARVTWFIPWLQIGVAAVLCVTTFHTLRATAPRPTEGKFADRDLPSLTVAIPARNETKDLEECLRTVLASDYPKLEVIVLDDCSQLPTADVIKGFAQQGVRFIPGKPPAKRWLPKNQAYQALYREASGEIVIFCGVDVRFGVSAVRELVYQMLERNKRMVSVLPVRRDASLQDSYIQPMRYWWELVLPRKLFNRPAVLSTCWAIYREDIHALGSFKATSRSVMPEQYFARELVRKDTYSFLRSSSSLDIVTVKSLEEQRRTALRMRYPQLHKRPEWVYLLLVGYGFFILWPMAWPLVYLADGPWKLSLVAAGLLALTHIQILRATDPTNAAFGAFTLPFAILTDFVLVIDSMLRYEFFAVFWKERNICLPVMHVYPGLPRLDKSGGEEEHTTAT